MKTKTSNQPKRTKLAVQLKDIKPKKNAKGGSNAHEMKKALIGNFPR